MPDFLDPGDGLAAVLLYGSCLRADEFTEGIVDLYAVVDGYGAAYPSRFLRLGNALLPPNVFYLEDRSEDPTLRAKYAVVSREDFEEGCTSWFHPYLWARFAQPSRLVYARDEAAGRAAHRAVAAAVVRFLREAAPLLPPGDHPVEELWAAGLTRAYASELRAERGRASTLVAAQPEALRRLTMRAAPAIPWLRPESSGDRVLLTHNEGRGRRARARWGLRRWQGRLLSVLRLVKAASTFENGLDYLAWKIHRHTGHRIPVTPGLRRHPVLGGIKTLSHLLKRGLVR